MRKLSEKSMENQALYYLRRFSPSVKQFKQVMLRKAKRRIKEAGGELEAAVTWLDALTERFQKLGYLDDSRLAVVKAASLRRGGKSSRMMQAQLKQKGLGAELVTKVTRDGPEAELEAAKVLARKKRLGPWSKVPLTPELSRKHLATLARAGYSYAVAKQVMASER